MFNALCKSGRRTKYSVLSNKNPLFEKINAVSVSHLVVPVILDFAEFILFFLILQH